MTKRYDENLGEPLRAVKEDVEKEWLTLYDQRLCDVQRLCQQSIVLLQWAWL